MKLFKYIAYVIETIDFNDFYKTFHRSQISLFDNCSWKSFIRNTEESTYDQEN